MDRRERIGDPEEMMRMAQEGAQGKLWTAMPGIIQSFDALAMTCTVQPSISAIVRDEDGTIGSLQLPLLLDCPVVFQGGGGVTMTFPIAKGDECLVVFASRCIDAWWQLGGVQGQAELRMHDLSDGFVLAGVRSQPRKISVNTSAAQLRSDDGSTLIELNPTAKTIAMTAPNGATINANTTINGTLHVTGAVTCDSTLAVAGNTNVGGTLIATGNITGAGKSLNSHTHSGVQTGGGTSGPPT
jgi:phage baseplate assembly protein gpV